MRKDEALTPPLYGIPYIHFLDARQWSMLPQRAKLQYYARAISLDSSPRVFTIRFTHGVLQSCWASRLPPGTFFAQRLRDRLKGISWFAVLEGTAQRTAHMHGILNPNGRSDDEIKAELMRVAGDRRKLKTPAYKHFYSHYAVDYRPPDPSARHGGASGLAGWVNYMAKNLEITRTKMEMDTTLITVSRPINRVARRLFFADLISSVTAPLIPPRTSAIH